MSRSIVKPATILEQTQALKDHYGVQELAYILGCSESTLRKWLAPEFNRTPNLVYRRSIEELYRKLPKAERGAGK